MSVAFYGAVSQLCCLSFLVLRRSIARHHQDNAELMRLHAMRLRKNLIASSIYMASIPTACVHVPLAVVFLVLPPLMYFVPDRRVEAGTSE